MTPAPAAPDGPLLGAHVSVAGGLERAFSRADRLGCRALQIFVKNRARWRDPPLGTETIGRFRERLEAARARGAPFPVLAHASYLINLASADTATRTRSRRALEDELRRSETLGVDALVFHPGAHLGDGAERGLRRIARGIDAVLERVEGSTTRLLLENTAGQGTLLGADLRELAELLERCAGRQRLGVCLDTCHAFAAGYPIHRERGWNAFLDEARSLFRPEELAAFHLNDSAAAFASCRDRHANIGRGHLGSRAFGRIVRDPRLRGLPLILETPRGEDGAGHREDLRRLRRMVARGRG